VFVLLRLALSGRSLLVVLLFVGGQGVTGTTASMQVGHTACQQA
jgi:hypothetical protein